MPRVAVSAQSTAIPMSGVISQSREVHQTGSDLPAVGSWLIFTKAISAVRIKITTIERLLAEKLRSFVD